jgi:putative hemolysin
MQLEMPTEVRNGTARYAVRLAASEAEVTEAQRLRWQVFAEEQGAHITSPVPGLDIDRFDPHCEHLIVRDLSSDQVIGTYRLLTASKASQIGGYYSECEFDLSAFRIPRRDILEIGRSCVHRDFRSGAVISLLWSGLAGFLMRSGHTALIGCASIPLAGQEEAASHLARELFRKHPSNDSHRVIPRRPLPFVSTGAQSAAPIPPLIKGYLRSGAVVCGEPCWDPTFATADVFVFLGLRDIDARYARRFLQPTLLDVAP